jgi:hypothetical protein
VGADRAERAGSSDLRRQLDGSAMVTQKKKFQNHAGFGPEGASGQLDRTLSDQRMARPIARRGAARRGAARCGSTTTTLAPGGDSEHRHKDIAENEDPMPPR